MSIMKLYTTYFGVDTLKVTLAVFLSDHKVEIEELQSEDKKVPYLLSSRLPVLHLGRGDYLFSSNAICRYLITKHKKEDIDYRVDEWLEWENTNLKPHLEILLHCVHNGKHVDPITKSSVLSLLRHLDTFLGNRKYISLSNHSPGLTDVIIWSTIYPLAVDNSISTEYLSSFPEVCRWFSHLSENELFQKAAFHVFKHEHIEQKGFSTKRLEDITSEIKKGENRNLCSSADSEGVRSDAPVTKEELVSAEKSWLTRKIHSPRVINHPILPKEGEKNILITSALPYVNNVPHLGNIIGAVLSADVFARYCRLRNYNTLYVCGTDEYGTATETKALEEKTTPEEICNKYFKLHSEIYKWFNVSFDYFGRTSTQQQTRIAQDIFWKLHKNQYLIEDTVEQLFCEKCQRFLADRFVEGICPFCSYEDARGDQCDKCGRLINATELKNAHCHVCAETPHLKTSRHLFLDLPKLEPILKEYLDKETKTSHWTSTAKVITYAWLKDGLKPRCITRDLKWGTPVPLHGFKDKVFYVWFDAPIGYLSITANYTNQWEQWWKRPDLVQLYQFMAKDNVPFHGIIFPASQLGAKDNYTIINHLAAVEYLNYEDTKFSKSRGIGVFGNEAKDTGIPADIWRFYLMYIRPEGQDSSFSWNDLLTKNNSELLNNLGNFINRTLTFIFNNFGGVIPEMNLTDDDKVMLAHVNRELKQYVELMEKVKLRDAIRHILNISRMGNQHVQANKPWELIKGTSEEKARTGALMGLCANISCLLATLLEPYMPDTCAILRSQLNTSPDYHILVPEFSCLLQPGHTLGKPSPLFKKIEQDQLNKLKMKFAGKQNAENEKSKSTTKNKVLISDSAKDGKLAGLEELTSLVAQQGDKVRHLKMNKAVKADIDREVAVLLDLKKQLAVASGQDPATLITSGKRKSKK